MLSQKKKTRIVGCPFGYQGELFIHSKNILHRDIHSVQHIQDHVHSILHTNKHQPWAQPHAFHSSCIQDHVHSIHHSQDHVHNIHHKGMAQHQPWARLQPHAFHNRNILVHGTQNSQGVPVHTHDILHTEGRGQ